MLPDFFYFFLHQFLVNFAFQLICPIALSVQEHRHIIAHNIILLKF